MEGDLAWVAIAMMALVCGHLWLEGRPRKPNTEGTLVEQMKVEPFQDEPLQTGYAWVFR